MKTSACSLCSAVVLSLFLASPAVAIQPVMKKGTAVQQAPAAPTTPQALPSTPVQQTPPVTSPAPASLQKLPVSIKINPAHLQGVQGVAFNGLSPEFNAAWKRVVDAYNNVTSTLPAFEQQVQAYIAQSQECRNKSYSQQEMTLAGCTASDTVEACSKKLYSKCMAASPSSNMSFLPMAANIGSLQYSSKSAYDEFIKSIVDLSNK